MDTVTTLQKLGLTQKQASVYMAMLELGEAPMTDIAKKANLKRPTVYLMIDELNLLGLAGEITKGKKKFYSAVHPKRFAELAKFRAEQADKILPELVALQKTSNKPKVRMLEGLKGAETAYQEALELMNANKEGLTFGNISLLKENFPEVLKIYNQILKKLRNPNIREIIYGGQESEEWVDEMNARKIKSYEARYLDQGFAFGKTDQLIVGDKVMIFSLGKEMFVTIIESKEIADTQRVLFELAWSKAK